MEWRDLDGLADCYQSCTVLQRGAGVVYIAGPAAVVLLLLVALWDWLIREHRKRRPREP